jgi:tripartite-type tricarboxylate transporter receptor subunit TctC
VATFQELGVKDVNVDMWYAFFAPNRTPAPVINRLNTEIAAIMKLPDVRAVLAKAGLDAASSTTTELTTTVKQDYVRWGAVIKRNAITAD